MTGAVLVMSDCEVALRQLDHVCPRTAGCTRLAFRYIDVSPEEVDEVRNEEDTELGSRDSRQCEALAPFVHVRSCRGLSRTLER